MPFPKSLPAARKDSAFADIKGHHVALRVAQALIRRGPRRARDEVRGSGYRSIPNRGAVRATPSARTAPTVRRTTRAIFSKSIRSMVSAGS
jgi:hypothetical protein